MKYIQVVHIWSTYKKYIQQVHTRITHTWSKYKQYISEVHTKSTYNKYIQESHTWSTYKNQNPFSMYSELKTLEWLISSSILYLLFFLISRSNNACSSLIIKLLIFRLMNRSEFEGIPFKSSQLWAKNFRIVDIWTTALSPLFLNLSINIIFKMLFA